jgi:hypothetical protein
MKTKSLAVMNVNKKSVMRKQRNATINDDFLRFTNLF